MVRALRSLRVVSVKCVTYSEHIEQRATLHIASNSIIEINLGTGH